MPFVLRIKWSGATNSGSDQGHLGYGRNSVALIHSLTHSINTYWVSYMWNTILGVEKNKMILTLERESNSSGLSLFKNFLCLSAVINLKCFEEPSRNTCGQGWEHDGNGAESLWFAGKSLPHLQGIPVPFFKMKSNGKNYIASPIWRVSSFLFLN